MTRQPENASREVEFEDMQGLLRFGYGHLKESRLLLLQVNSARHARLWLANAPVTTAQRLSKKPKMALQLAFSSQGLHALGVPNDVIEEFSDEFISDVQGDENRSRRLGDIGVNAPDRWQWGGKDSTTAHVLVLIYSVNGAIETAANTLMNNDFSAGFSLLRTLPSATLSVREPFGFVDGISQPEIDWEQSQTSGKDSHGYDHYTNQVAPGEMVLGYRNEYSMYTPRPLLDPSEDARAAVLPNAEDQPQLKDFARNGSYLVFRQLRQDVEGFWRYLDAQATSNAKQRELLATRMVGRKRNGTPLISNSRRRIAGINPASTNNHFTYDQDQDGVRCPIGSHVRRSNPRSGDFPADVSNRWSRLLRRLGFCQKRDDDDLIASSRFHRLIRRGRAYGPPISPEEAIRQMSAQEDRGLHFICLVGNISRQFEFVQNAWNMHSKFAGLENEQDPILGNRAALNESTRTDKFSSPQQSGLNLQYRQLPEFVTVVGAGYFFMPGIKALRYIASATETTE